MKNKLEVLDDEDKNSEYYIEDEEKRLTSFNYKIKQIKYKKVANKLNLLKLSNLPIVYLVFYFSIIPIILWFYFQNPEATINEIKYSNIYQFESIVSCIVFSICGIIGVHIIIFNYFAIVLFKESKGNDNLLLQYMCLLFGLIVFCLDFILGFIGTFKNFKTFNTVFTSSTSYDVFEFLLLCKISFLLIYSGILISDIYNTDILELSKFNKYLLIISAYTFLFLCAYFYMKTGHLESFFPQKEIFSVIRIKIMLLFPYILHFFIGFIVYFNSYLLENSSLSLNQITYENPITKTEKFEL